MQILWSLVLFLVAGIFEIGGGWLVWQSVREHKPWTWALLGSVLLLLYGLISTLQSSHFGRIYAVYGGFFIVLSLLWGWWCDGNRPDFWDVVGGTIAMLGVLLMMYGPRGAAAPIVE